MYDQLSFFQMASAMARHAAARHKVIARNIANADTPGFRAQDVRPFSEYVNESLTARASLSQRTEAKSLAEAAFRPRVLEDKDVDAGPNGNSVSLEREMVKATQAQGQHTLATAIYRKAHDLIRLGLGRGR